jgi:hypothetical protein
MVAAGGVVCLLGLTGCYRAVVEGEVFDNEGEALPGVAVTIDGSTFQDVTNSRGGYQVRFRPGQVRLEFSKTGYTSAQMELNVGAMRRVQAEAVRLWRLPPKRGVYFLEEGRYLPLDSTQPRQFGDVYGMEEWAEASTSDPEPRLIAHRLPSEGLSLVPLVFTEVVKPDAESEEEFAEVLAPASRDPIALTATLLDPPEGLLQELRCEEPLEPGTYAVQWGALDGDPSIEPLIYYFNVEAPTVLAPEAPEPDQPDGEGEAAAEGEER